MHKLVVGVRKPSAKRQRAVVPPSLAVMERMRALLLAERRLRDATLLAVLAYAGLRPQEALALPWQSVRDRTLLIDRAQSDEGLKGTKTGRTRSVRLLAPLGADLAAWRLASDRAGADELVFPTASGELWRDHDWRNRRRRVFDPLAASVGARGMRPYDPRHAFCSLLIAEGLSVVEVRGLATDATYIASVAVHFDGPALLVGHGYGGAVASVAASHADNVVGLVYIAGLVLERDESAVDAELFPNRRTRLRCAQSSFGPRMALQPSISTCGSTRSTTSSRPTCRRRPPR